MWQRILIVCAVVLGKTFSFLSKTFNLGHGSTWPGHLALKFSPNIFTFFSKQVKEKIVLIAGTNGKTTTSLMIRSVLTKQGKKVIHNDSGANLLNGLVSAFILKSNLWGIIDVDNAIFEVDEATLPVLMNNVQFKIYNYEKLIFVLLNLFRDQLDRYGEVDTIARKWNEALETLSADTTLILNADDPQIAELGIKKKAKVLYFGLEDKKLFLKHEEYATDSTFCLNCGAKLDYDGIFYSHLGHWQCPSCLKKRPTPDLSIWPEILPGVYNRYNTLAAVLALTHLGISKSEINKSLDGFKPAFGRQEELVIDGKKVRIFLAKNPAGFNESLRTVISLGAKQILLVLNDRIPDGRDVSWIWDVDFEMLPMDINRLVSGDRAYDMAVRLKYSGESQKSKVKSKKYKSKVKSNNITIKQWNNFLVEESLEKVIKIGLEQLPENETLYILPTYSAMLEVRKILGGKRIL